MGGMLTEVRQKATKAGNLMGFATLEDLTGTIEALVFPRVLERVSTELMPGYGRGAERPPLHPRGGGAEADARHRRAALIPTRSSTK